MMTEMLVRLVEALRRYPLHQSRPDSERGLALASLQALFWVRGTGSV
jgi:hypothetical protein